MAVVVVAVVVAVKLNKSIYEYKYLLASASPVFWSVLLARHERRDVCAPADA